MLCPAGPVAELQQSTDIRTEKHSYPQKLPRMSLEISPEEAMGEDQAGGADAARPNSIRRSG